jgi:hypothetical protein
MVQCDLSTSSSVTLRCLPPILLFCQLFSFSSISPSCISLATLRLTLSCCGISLNTHPSRNCRQSINIHLSKHRGSLLRQVCVAHSRSPTLCGSGQVQPGFSAASKWIKLREACPGPQAGGVFALETSIHSAHQVPTPFYTQPHRQPHHHQTHPRDSGFLSSSDVFISIHLMALVLLHIDVFC